MKWVGLSCGHSCWITWLEAFPGRLVICPGNSKGGDGSPGCIGKPQFVTKVYELAEVIKLGGARAPLRSLRETTAVVAGTSRRARLPQVVS